jgi:hypothetical protein
MKNGARKSNSWNLISEIRRENGKHRWLETTEKKEQSSWNLILMSLIEMSKQKVIYLGTLCAEDLRDM